MGNPLLSIVIATKNRIPYCIETINSILINDDSRFELIIQDNSDTRHLERYIELNIADERLKYNYTPPPLSFIDNFNSALKLVNGDYVCIIGDDDGINPEIVELIRWAKENNIDAIVPEIKAIYWWPDTCCNIPDLMDKNGMIKIWRINGTTGQYRTSKAIYKLMRNGGQNYMGYNLPKLYHGIIRRQHLNNLKNQLGYYVGGLSPDIYVTVALSLFVKRIIKIDYPLTISGICIASASADSATKKNTGKLEDAPHFRDRGVYSWASQVPKFYSGINIWADSALASLRDLGMMTIIKRFSISALTIHLLNRHKEYSELILNNYFDNLQVKSPLSKWLSMKLLLLKKFQMIIFKFNKELSKKIKIKLFYLFIKKSNQNKVTSYSNVLNINQATELLSSYLSTHDLSIEKTITLLEKKYCKKSN